jgi:HEAT repeat protein
MVLRTFGFALALALTMTPSIRSQELPASSDLFTRFDNEHDLTKKENLLRQITDHSLNAGPTLLDLAEQTRNLDTRWMAIRGLATLHYQASDQFLEESLTNPDAVVRSNAVRALADLDVTPAGPQIQAMFAKEKNPGAIEQATLALRVLHVRAAVPDIRSKIPDYTWQTRAWLLQALGDLGSSTDVPLIAGYLNSTDKASAISAAHALEELTGVNFGPPPNGIAGYPPSDLQAARKWWTSHEPEWPRCDDCNYK